MSGGFHFPDCPLTTGSCKNTQYMACCISQVFYPRKTLIYTQPLPLPPLPSTTTTPFPVVLLSLMKARISLSYKHYTEFNALEVTLMHLYIREESVMM